MTLQPSISTSSNLPKRTDYLLALLFAIFTLGFSTISGKPLSMHEARVPQLASEMQQEGRWLLPHSGGRPWLERPPLPHISTRISYELFGKSVFSARLPNVVAGIGIVLLGTWIAGRTLGRAAGFLTGLLLCTTYEFYIYAGQAEDDIYLALLVAIAFAAFIRMQQLPPPEKWKPLGNRPVWVWLFYVMLGLTSLAKGPGPGAVILVVGSVASAVAGGWQSWRRWVWPIGWLLAIALFLAWPVYAYQHYPSVLGNWHYDLIGGDFESGNKPIWYYFERLPGVLLPWTPLALLGLWVAWKHRKQDRTLLAIAAFALVPVLVMSLSSRKHHHYLVPLILPWTMLAAGTFVKVAPDWCRKLNWRPSTMRRVVAITLAVIAIGANVAQFLAYRSGRRTAQRDFAIEAGRAVPEGEPLVIVPGGRLEVFQFMFYSPRTMSVAQTPDYLLGTDMPAGPFYVLTQNREAGDIRAKVGSAERVLELDDGRHESGEPNQWSLFKVTRDPAKPQREPLPVPDVMQAMGRSELPTYE